MLLNLLSLFGSVAGLLAHAPFAASQLPVALRLRCRSARSALALPISLRVAAGNRLRFGAREINHFVVLPPAIAASDRSRR